MTTNPVFQNKQPVALPTMALAAFLALAVLVSPSRARADSGDAAAAVLLGAAIVYAAHESRDSHHQRVHYRVNDRRYHDYRYCNHRHDGYDRRHAGYYRGYGHQNPYYPSYHGRDKYRHDNRQAYRNDWKHQYRDDHDKHHDRDRDRGHSDRDRGEKRGKQFQASVHMHQRF